MENANHNIDDIFRQRLHEAEVPPPPFVWPAVENELRKRRRGWLLWLLAFGTVAATAVLLWLIQAHQKDLPIVVNNQKSNDAPVNVAKTTLRTQTNSVEANSTNTPQSLSSDYTAMSNPKDPAAQQLEGKKILKAKNAKEYRTVTALESDIVQKAANRVLNGGDQPSNFAVATSMSDVVPAAFIETDKSLAILKPQPVTSISQPKTIASPKSFKSLAKHKKIQPKICYDFSRHPSAWLLDVYAGPSLAQRSLTSFPDNQPYLNQRLATEQRNVAMNAGIRASFMFNGNILARTGLHYEQMTEVFEYYDPTTAIYSVQWNNILSKIDTLGVDYGESYLKTYNRYAMLDIPLLVGMEMRKGRSGFSLNAGISANVLFAKRGMIIDPNTNVPARFGPMPAETNKIVQVGSLSEDVFRTNLGLSAIASIQWYWHLTPTFRLFVEPSYRQVLRPLTLSSHPVEQRYSLFGLRMGATKIF